MMVALRTFKSFAILLGMALIILALPAPAIAHKDHKKKPVETEHSMPMTHGNEMQPASAGSPEAIHAQMGEMMEEPDKDRSNMSMVERLLDWLGRTHPVIVHFPIAFLPAAFAMALVGRQRPTFAAPVRFLVVAGGTIAPAAALLGWLDGGFDLATDDWLLQLHRWLGTAIGLGAFGLAAWAWRNPQASRRPGMIAGLGLMTIAIVTQGWLGGAMVHGVDHLNW